VNAAGRTLVAGTGGTADSMDRYLEAYAVMSNWRASHQFPLNTFKINLRERARSIDEHAFVAQRLKRAPSIIAKLSRFPAMRLTQMQDIGGCRAVVSTLADVQALRDALKSSRIKHRLVNEKVWLDFFSLVSAAFAIREGVDGPHDLRDVQKVLRVMERDLHVIDRLTAFQRVMKAAVADPERRLAAYFLMVLDAPNEEVTVLSYAANEFDKATAEYKRVEEAAKPGVDAVLVVADSAHALRVAYPNYFGDTSLFIAELQNIIAPIEQHA